MKGGKESRSHLKNASWWFWTLLLVPSCVCVQTFKGRDWQGCEDTKEEETEKKTEKEAGKPQEKLEAMKKKKTDVKKENGKDETEKFIQTVSPVNERPKPSEDASVAPQKQADDPTNAPDLLWVFKSHSEHLVVIVYIMNYWIQVCLFEI